MRPSDTSNARPRRGLNAIEVIVVVVILSIFVLSLMAALPRRLETARRTSCQRNLMQIGFALVLYDQAAGHLPIVPELATEASRANSPLKTLLEALGVPDLREANDASNPPPRQPGFVASERPVPGFICPSDRNAAAGYFPAPISYRASAGDGPESRDGVFAPGRRISISGVEAGDGASYTAAFAERLVGNNRPERALPNYAVVPGPVPRQACPPAEQTAWKGDAGASWFGSNWQSTLYNHALTPNAAPSCMADDGRTALIGASSGHPGGVNVLTLDAAVKLYTSGVDPEIWRSLATPESQREGAEPARR
jgi:type II secretory pathway pseudopilin PulG